MVVQAMSPLITHETKILRKRVASSFFGNNCTVQRTPNKQRSLLTQYRHEGGKSKVEAGVYNPQTEVATFVGDHVNHWHALTNLTTVQLLLARHIRPQVRQLWWLNGHRRMLQWGQRSRHGIPDVR